MSPLDEFIENLPYYILPALFLITAFISSKISNVLFTRSLKTPAMRELWKILLSIGIDDEITISRWRRKNSAYVRVYFIKNHTEQTRDPLHTDAQKIRQYIMKEKKDRKKFLPIIIILDEIIGGKILTRDELVEKYAQSSI